MTLRSCHLFALWQERSSSHLDVRKFLLPLDGCLRFVCCGLIAKYQELAR